MVPSQPSTSEQPQTGGPSLHLRGPHHWRWTPLIREAPDFDPSGQYPTKSQRTRRCCSSWRAFQVSAGQVRAGGALQVRVPQAGPRRAVGQQGGLHLNTVGSIRGERGRPMPSESTRTVLVSPWSRAWGSGHEGCCRCHYGFVGDGRGGSAFSGQLSQRCTSLRSTAPQRPQSR